MVCSIIFYFGCWALVRFSCLVTILGLVFVPNAPSQIHTKRFSSLTIYRFSNLQMKHVLNNLVLSGEQSSEVEIWDLKSVNKFAQLPSNIPGSSSNVCDKN
ncbi:hypothetical protein K1719_009429 [Acacia pycnantha]|nr:hypothetical protein K1719_009429 [Acacia pycnantha]